MDGPGLYCIIGPNGVGKSTLIKCINKILRPTSGKVLIDNVDVKEYSMQDLACFMGYVPISSNDCFSMTVVDTVLMGRYGKNKWRTTREDILATNRTLKLFQLDCLAMRGFNELSAGQHQRVILARGIVRNPGILILDEPTANLDIHHQIYVVELLREISVQSEMMIFMISHDLNIAAKYADKIIVMAPPGIIYNIGRPQDVINEELIHDIYGVECEIIMRNGRPHVIPGTTIRHEPNNPETSV